MKKTAALLLAAILAAAVLAACSGTKGGSQPSSATGTYIGEYYKCIGDDFDQRNTEDEFSIVLEEGGKGSFIHDGETYGITWKLDGENFSMTEDFMGLVKLEYTGTLKGGELKIINGDPENVFTYEYLLKKQ